MKQDEGVAKVAADMYSFAPEELRSFFTPPVGDIVVVKLRATRTTEVVGGSHLVDEAPFPDVSRLLTRVRLTRTPTTEFAFQTGGGRTFPVTRVEVYPCEEYLQVDTEDGPEFAFDIGLLIERTPLAEAIASLVADAHTILRSHSGSDVVGMTIEARTDKGAAIIALVPIGTELTADDVLTSAPSVLALPQYTQPPDGVSGAEIETGIVPQDDAPEVRQPQMTPVLGETQRLVGMQQHRDVTVFYATNRLCVDGKHTCDRATDLQLGRCAVAIPASHRRGDLEQPRLLAGYRWVWNPEKHVMITDEQTLDSESWLREVAHDARRRSRAELIVLIHGYNTDHDEAIRRAAQIHYDASFSGVLVVFSWPSFGETADYLGDRGNAEYSVRYLRDFLVAITRAHADTVHVIAHSMGNRILLPALNELATGKLVRVGEVVLTAADYDCGVLDQMIATIHPLTERMTMYASARDLAVAASSGFHRNPVAGDASDYFYFRPDYLDTVDASGLASVLALNHFYSAEHPLGLQELREVVEYRLPAERRWAIEPREGGGWQFKTSFRR